MKRLWIILPITLLLLASAPDVMAQELCSEIEQAFTLPEAAPFNEGDWLLSWGTSTVEPDPDEDIDDDGFRVYGTSGDGFNQQVNLRWNFIGTATITELSGDIIAASTDVAQIVIIICYTTLCDEGTISVDYELDISGIQEDPFHYFSDTEYTDVVGIIVSMQCGGISGNCEIDNVVIEGVIEACVFRPVHEDDQVDEAASGDLYVITTNAGVRVYAIDDAVVQTVLHNADGYFVRLLVNGTTQIIYSKLSATFAEPGDTIQGGCVLGYVSQAGPEAQVDTGQVAYQHDSDLGDWHDYPESLSTTPCGQETTNCLNTNPEMNTDEAGWLTRFNSGGSFNQGDDSVKSLVGAGMLYQPGLAVDFSATYFVTLIVALQPPATDGEIRVWFGGTETRLPIHTLGPEFVTLTTLGFSTAFEGTSEFRIYNSSSNSPTIRVTFACLHVGDAVIAPPSCYFEDALLNSDSFETEGGATFETGLLGQGQYTLEPGDAIRAPVHIEGFSDADADFTLAITGAGSDGEAEITASIVDSDTDDELQAIGSYTFPLLLWATFNRQFTVDQAESLDGDLYIENTGAETVLIGSICLSSNAGVWPGYDNADAGNHDILAVDCQECQFPESLVDVVAWLNWLGCMINYLIRCLLYSVVNNIWATVSAVLSGLGLLGLWLGRAIVIVATWAWAAAGRLLAALVSSLIPIVNAVLAWLFTQPFFLTILDAISIVGLWLAAIFDFITLVRNFIVLAFNYGIAILLIVVNTYSAFYAAVSSPATYHIFPDCTDPGGALYDMCLGFDIMAFIFDQLPMALVFLGLLGALILMAQFGRVLELIGDLAENL